VQASERYVDWVCKFSLPSDDPEALCAQPYFATAQYEYFYLFNLTNVRRTRVHACVYTHLSVCLSVCLSVHESVSKG
jgi:hypothetical protein